MSEDDEKFSKERRRAPRVGGSIVEYSVEGRNASLRKAFIKDICIYGICVYVPEMFDEKSVLDLNIYLFGLETPINPKGRVVWQKPGGFLGYYNVGIEFTDISDECTKILSNHIELNFKEKEEKGEKRSILE
jgi:hypothetical protein